MIKESLKKYLIKKYGNEFEIISCEKVGKDYNMILDFGVERLGISVRERNGGNGNYRIIGVWDET